MRRREFFVKNGYWVEPDPLFSGTELKMYQQSMMEIMNHRYKSGREPMSGRNWPNQTDPNGPKCPKRAKVIQTYQSCPSGTKQPKRRCPCRRRSSCSSC